MSSDVSGLISWLRGWFDDIYQSKLVSGTNIKTINNENLLGSGNIAISVTGNIDNTVTQNSSNPVKSSGIYSALSSKVDESDLLDLIYPIGAIYMSVNSTNPSVLLGGTWEHINNCFLLASEYGQGLGQTGGEASHTLTVDEMPNHTHSPPSWVHYASSGGNTGNYSVTRVTANNGNTYVNSTPQTNKDVGYTGGGQAHNNMPPYLIVNVWKRTA